MKIVKEQTVNILTFKGSATKKEMDKALLDNDCAGGDVFYCVDDGFSYVRSTNEFIKLAPSRDLSDDTPYNDTPYKHKKIINKCNNCGASLPLSDEVIEKGWVQCSYCRSVCKTFEWTD